MHVFLPSRPTLRNIADGLEKEEKVQKATWFKETGRPTTVYHMPGQLPFDAENRCGQCAFYVSLRRQCRIWWLLNKSYGYGHDRWRRDGASPLSDFEVHKMKNSWRIGPHSSACSKFVDKKKDYVRKALPALCDTCNAELPTLPPKSSMVICKNCRTRYFTLKQVKVKVLTSYEHEFSKRYQELAGVDPSSDLKRLIEERQGSAPSIMERAIYKEHRRPSEDDPDKSPKTVMIFPGDRMLAKDEKLYVFKRRNVESLPLAGSTLIDLGDVVGEEQKGTLESAGMTVRSVSKSNGPGAQDPRRESYDIAPAVERVVRDHPEFLRSMALAMAKSATHATERAGSLARLPSDYIQDFARKQRTLTRRLERLSKGSLLVYEAMVMKEYWSCYHLALDTALQRSRPAQEGAVRQGVRHEPRGPRKGIHGRGRGDKLPPPEEAVQGQVNQRPARSGPQSRRRVPP